MLSMLFGHVPWFGGHAWIIFPNMGGDAFVQEIDLYQLVTGMQLNLFAYEVMRHRVQVMVVNQVIIDIDAGIFDVGVLVSVLAVSYTHLRAHETDSYLV